LSADLKEAALSAPTGTLRAYVAGQEDDRMQNFPTKPFCMFRTAARLVPVGVLSVLALASLAKAQIAPNMPTGIAAPHPLTATLSIFSDNMQDKIIKAADMMPESKYNYRPTKDVRSFGEIVTHVADISYYLCSNMKGVATPAGPAAKSSKAEIIAYLKNSFSYCDDAFAGFTDAHLNDPADFWGHRTNKMFILTQLGNHDALHYGNLVTYLRINGLEPSGGWF
jgi:uncharacterized damage-inducible protein DinB